jgi:hypothetical protein
MRATEGRPVCILGVGRSGTSLAARAVNLLGVDLGPEETMLPPDRLNPSGYWEQREIVALNDDILAALGGEWWRPPPRPKNWETAPEMAPFRERIRDLVKRSFQGRRWGFKDPRTTLTLPIWESAVGELDRIVCLRNPLEVIASAGNGLPAGADPIAIWLHYSCEALRHTAGGRRAFVFYERWSADPRGVGRDLAMFVNGVVEEDAPESIASAFDTDLRRQHAGDLELAERSDVAPEARALHFLVRSLAEAEADGRTERAQALQAVVAALDTPSVLERGEEAPPS